MRRIKGTKVYGDRKFIPGRVVKAFQASGYMSYASEIFLKNTFFTACRIFLKPNVKVRGELN